MTIKLFLLTACMIAVLLLAQYPLRRKHSKILNILCFIVKTALMCVISLLNVVIMTKTVWHMEVVISSVYAALAADIITDIFRSVIRFAGIRREKTERSGYKGTVVLTAVICAAFLTLGTVNYYHVVLKPYVIESDKLTQSCTAAFISDVHYGNPQGAGMLESAVDKINEAGPDLVILGGDITDDFTTKAEMEEAYSILGKIKADTYYIFGNHDRQSRADIADGRQYTEAELVSAIEGNGIRILQDEAVEISDELVLLGREDVERESRRAPDELPETASDVFLLTADHQPYATEDILAEGADLQLSGHSHAGQLFPNRIIYQILGYDAYGKYDIGSTKLIVSAGESLWNVPLRTEAHSEILMVTIKPAS